MKKKYELEERSCDVCGSTDSEELYVSRRDNQHIVIPDGDDIVQNRDVFCRQCGLVYKSPSFTKDSMDKFYREDYTPLYRPGWNETISRQSVVYTMISSIIIGDWLESKLKVRGSTMLDVGAGDGMFMKCMESKGMEVYGIDQDVRGAEMAYKLLSQNVYVGDFMDLSGDSKFDIVCMRNTLEHMYSPTQALEKAITFMKDDGYMLVELPSADRPYSNGYVGSFLSSAHNYTFTIGSFDELCKKVGLGIVDLSYEGHCGCMMLILKKGEGNITTNNEPIKTLAFIRDRYAEHDRTFFKIKEIILDLFESTNVNNSIGTIRSNKHTSNLIVFNILVNASSGNMTHPLIADLLDTYEWDPNQAGDVNCSAATVEFIKGMFYRELGDFKQADDHIKIAMSMYPDVLSKNFVKELILEGVLSESVFNESIWYACSRQSKMMV